MISDRPAIVPAQSLVAVAWGPTRYEATAPFSPGIAIPEYPFKTHASPGGANEVYATVRESLRLLKLDAAHFGQSEWNPLGEMAQPGQMVVLKPNFVRHFRETQPGHDDCLVTHGSVIRAVLDYVYIALKGRGRIVIADACHNDAEFEPIRQMAGLDEIQEFYRREAGFEVEVYDLRPEKARKVNGVIVGHTKLAGDPAGYAKVNLGLHSAFAEVKHLCHLLYGAEYDTGELHSHHHDEVHEYLISRTVLLADCVISIPKLKTHKKTGITVSLKNLVGINGNKNWLPHHREGTPAQGGDQFASDGLMRRLERKSVAQFKRIFPLLGALRPLVAGPIKAIGKRIFGDTNTGAIRSGNWYGNDTTWRMVLDLNRILMYADAEGQLHDRRVRRLFTVVDGIVAGEGNGPLDPTAKPAGVIVAGANPVAADLACARVMGLDYQRIPLLCRAMDEHPLPLADFGYSQVTACSNSPACDQPLTQWQGPHLAFRPHFGWRGHIELREGSL